MAHTGHVSIAIAESTRGEVSDVSGVGKEGNVVEGTGHIETAARWTSDIGQVVVSTRNTIDNTSGSNSPVTLNLETSYERVSDQG